MEIEVPSNFFLVDFRLGFISKPELLDSILKQEV